MALKTRKFKVSSGSLTLPSDVNTDDFCIEDRAEENTPREKLDQFLNRIGFQGVVVALVVMDTLLVLFLLLIELQVIQVPPGHEGRQFLSGNVTNTPPGDHNVNSAENVMQIVQLTVLSVFIFEIILRIVARGVDLVYDKWQVFDVLVVLVTFALYVALTAAVTSRLVTYSVGFLIFLRMWRVGRIHYDLTQPLIQKARSLILAHRRAWKHTEEELKQSRLQTQCEQEKVQALKRKLRALNASTSPVDFSSPSPSTFSGDTCTLNSEDGSHAQSSRAPSGGQRSVQGAPSLAIRTLRSRSLPSTTPRGSFETDSSMSLPGSPKSLSYLHNNQTKMISHGSSGKIPDLVEHTQSADLCRDQSFKEALAMRALALDTTNSQAKQLYDYALSDEQVDVSLQSFPNNNTSKQVFWTNASQNTNSSKYSESQSGSMVTHKDPSPYVSTDANSHEDSGSVGGSKYRKNPDRGSTDKRLSHCHRERSTSANNLVDAARERQESPTGTSSQMKDSVSRGESSTLPRIRRDHQDGHLYPSDKGDKRQLLDADNKARPADFAFSNPSFSGLTEEELMEIARVSQVPFDQFGSISHLLQEGIPISEL